MRSWVRLAGVLAIAATVLATSTVAFRQPASAFAAFQYGRHYPNGVAAVEYIYSSEGTFKPLSSVTYGFNYYPECHTTAHQYGRQWLINNVTGSFQATALDADGHLLLDFNHDGEIDVTSGGSAFQEHNARGAGNAQVGQPFNMFWFDDNWLARYMAQAYGRQQPDGLHDYGPPGAGAEGTCDPDIRTRWRILGGDTRWRPYNGDQFDRLALDGLYHLALGDLQAAVNKWRAILDKSGYFYDFHTGVHEYPEFHENYHIGLFKILTEQLIASGQLGTYWESQLIQHSVDLRGVIVASQQRDATHRYLTGWTSGRPAGTHIMNTESIAINSLALGAGARTAFVPGQAPMFAQPNGYVSDATGVLSADDLTATRGHMTYGPYLEYPAGTYTVDFVVRAFGPSGTVADLDVYDARAGRILAQRSITSTALGSEGRWVRVSLPITVGATPNQLEFRTWWHGNSPFQIAEIRVR